MPNVELIEGMVVERATSEPHVTYSFGVRHALKVYPDQHWKCSDCRVPLYHPTIGPQPLREDT